MTIITRTLALAAALIAFAQAAPLQARPLDIVAIGASNTTGFGSRAKRLSAVLQALLRKKGIAANVINAGVNGDVTAGMLPADRRRRTKRHRHRDLTAGRQRSALPRHQRRRAPPMSAWRHACAPGGFAS